MASRNGNRSIYQLKIVLMDVVPPVWRRLLVGRETTLHRLHFLIQEAMGWKNAPLYRFESQGLSYSEPDPEWEEFELKMKDSNRAILSDLLQTRGGQLLYEYDFGDGWEHEILLEDVLPFDSLLSYPLCIGGARACPPEDCGGSLGYENFLLAIRDPEHEEHDEKVRWIGGFFDPEGFDPNDVNERFWKLDRAMRKRIGRRVVGCQTKVE